jgi:Cu/Ag efflux protein CusF
MGKAMRRKRNKGLGELLFSTTGWLFADLFVALTMGFLVANTFPQVIPPAPTPTPTAPPVTPTPTVIKGIDKNAIKLTITVDHEGIINNDPKAVQDAEQQVMSYAKLQGKRAGVVETFGGTLASGATIAEKFNTNVLTDLGNKKHFVFFGGPLFQSFHDTEQDINTVVVYVFVYN